MKRFLLGTSAIALALASGSPVYAQTTTNASDGVQVADAGTRSTRIETVTVTAQRREESSQDVGIALSVLTDKDLAERNIDTVNQLQFAVPSFEVVPAFGSGQPEFRLRGVGFDDYGSNNSSTVGVYLDEVAYPIPASTQGLLFDISRVEVLRGPQGTLYGRNTTGGAVNFITNKPTDNYTAGITGDYDSHDEFRSEGYVSGPISDTLKFRLSAVTDQGGAWQTNRTTGASLGDKNISAFRGQLEWTPTSKVDFLLEGNWGYDKSESNGLYLFSPLTFNPALTAVPADTDITHTGWGGSTAFQGLTGIAPDEKPFHNSVNQGVSLRANFDLGFADLTSITAYQHLRRREYDDWDASQYAYAGVYFDTGSQVFSQEIRLASKDTGPFTWLAGLYYSNESLDEAFDSDFWQSFGFDTSTTYNQYVNSIAAFAQIEYSFNDKLKFIGGLRAEDEVRKQKNYVTAGVFAPGTPPTDFSAPADKSLESKPLTGKAELEYKPSDNTLLYASISEGVKSGGFTSYNVPSATAVPAFKPEVLWAYETGFKSSFADDTLQLNGSVYYYDYHNQQVQSAIWTTAYGAIGAIVNAPKSHIYGGELEAEWRPTQDLFITQSLGYKDGSFDNFTGLNIADSSVAGTAVYVNYKGAKVGFPPLSYNGSISYQWDLGGYALEPEVDYAFHDQRKPLLLGPTYNIPSYWLANANLTLSPTNGPWDVTLYGHNIFNQKYDLERNFFLGGINIAAAGEPATVGVRVTFKY
jgi:outer membrane receptor protein involved in Fe transport